MSIDSRLNELPWSRIGADLDAHGWATTGALLTAQERQQLTASYYEDTAFRSTVMMARHGFGRGEYRYFAYPLPGLVQSLRERLYGQLLPIANQWRAALGSRPFPSSHAE